MSFPVGKVNRLQMHPMTFREFLSARGEGGYVELLADWPATREIPELYAAPLTDLLKEYYAVGGMPEVVSEWCESHDMTAVDEVQDGILQDYADDFAKHAPVSQVERIRWIWDSVPKQLGKENNKFVFSHVRAHKRSAELGDALQWLRDSGLVTKLELVSHPEVPLASATDATYFKVYLADLGLLRRRSGLTFRAIAEGDALFSRYKGALAENYVLNELVAQGTPTYFWRSGNTAEVDMLAEVDGRAIPIEVKSADNVQAKSYRQYCARYAPQVGYKVSLKNMGESTDGGTRTVSLPLYLMWNWRQYL